MMFGLKSSPKSIYLLAMLVCALVGGTPFGWADDGAPTTITSRTMIAQGHSNRVLFEGKVVLTKGDLTMRSNKMIVRFKDKPPEHGRRPEAQPLSRKVERIEAEGQVVIEKSDGRATCGRAVYYRDEEKMVLTESPVVWQDGMRVTGPRMTMFLKEDRSIVEGGSRVTILDEQGQ